jgi:hypothetical protein
MMKNARKYIYLLPPIFGFFVVLLYGVNVLYWDEWEIPLLVDNIINNGINFKEFFRQHNEHRIIIPKTIFLLNALLFDLNSKIMMFVSWFFVCTSFFMIIRYLRKDTKHRIMNLQSVFMELMIGFLLFSTIQAQNTLWGFQIPWFMVPSCLILSGISFQEYHESHKYKYLVILFVCSTIASFSTFQGLFVLPAVFSVILLLWLTNHEIDWRMSLSIIVFMLVVSAGYFYGWKKPGHHPALFAGSLLDIATYFLAAFGNPLIPEFFPHRIELTAGTGFVVTVTAIALVIWLIVKKRVADHILPLAMLVFSFLFVLSITAGRGGFGVKQALEGRYTTYSLLAIVSIVIIMYREFILRAQTSTCQKCVEFLLHYIFIMVMIQNCYHDKLNGFESFRKKNVEILLTYQTQGLFALKSNYPWKDIDSARKRIDIVAKHGWSVFANRKQ